MRAVERWVSCSNLRVEAWTALMSWGWAWRVDKRRKGKRVSKRESSSSWESVEVEEWENEGR